MKKSHIKIFFVFSALTLWETIARIRIFSPFIFPSITDTIIYMITHYTRLFEAITYTFKLLFIGLSISSCLSFILGTLSALSQRTRPVVEAIISIFNPVPAISMLPFAILWFGLGENAIIFITIFGSLCPYTLNIMNGLNTLRGITVEVGKNYGLQGLPLVRYILLPASLPHLITGFRSAWGVAWRSVVAAELVFGAVGGKGGLGWLIYVNRFQLNAAGMLGTLFCISLLGILMENIILEFIETKTVKKWGMKT